VAIDDEVEAELEHLGVAGLRVRVRERVAGNRELLEQPPRDGDVDAAELRCLRLDDGPRREQGLQSLLGRRAGLGTHQVGQPTARIVNGARSHRRSRRDRGDDRARGDRLRRELRDDVPGVPLRGPEEPRQHLGRVLVRDDLRELEHGRDAEPPLADRVEHLREPLDEPDRGLPVRGRAVRQPEVVHEEGEERVVPERHPRALPIEVREGGEELGEGVTLAAEQRDEDDGQLACRAHEQSFSCVFAAS
jgi:hypothetical protein